MDHPVSKTSLLFLAACVVASAIGCDSGDDDDRSNGGAADAAVGPDGSGGSGGSGGSSGGGASGSGGTSGSGGDPPEETPIGGPSTWDPPLEIPPAWDTPSGCGSLGEPCQGGGCEGDAMCNYDINICVPPRMNPINNFGCDNDCPRDYPYCLHYSCMTFQEASCFCNGSLGSQDPRCGDGPAFALEMCVSEGASCETDSDCCGTRVCLDQGRGRLRCSQTCSDDSECESGCCADYLEIGTAICAAAEECESPCKRSGEICQEDSECCLSECVTGTENPDFVGCRAGCNRDEDCATGCCQVYSNATWGFCVVAKYCGCGAEGAACGMYEPACCEDHECTSTDAEGEFTCKPHCQQHSDCPSNCCVPIRDTDFSVCYDASYCGG